MLLLPIPIAFEIKSLISERGWNSSVSSLSSSSSSASASSNVSCMIASAVSISYMGSVCVSEIVSVSYTGSTACVYSKGMMTGIATAGSGMSAYIC